jgi:TPR repeat protein
LKKNELSLFFITEIEYAEHPINDTTIEAASNYTIYLTKRDFSQLENVNLLYCLARLEYLIYSFVRDHNQDEGTHLRDCDTLAAKGARLGHSEANWLVGKIFESRLSDTDDQLWDVNFERTFTHLRKASELENTRARVLLADCYIRCYPDTKKEEAIELYRLAMIAGSKDAVSKMKNIERGEMPKKIVIPTVSFTLNIHDEKYKSLSFWEFDPYTTLQQYMSHQNDPIFKLFAAGAIYTLVRKQLPVRILVNNLNEKFQKLNLTARNLIKQFESSEIKLLVGLASYINGDFEKSVKSFSEEENHISQFLLAYMCSYGENEKMMKMRHLMFSPNQCNSLKDMEEKFGYQCCKKSADLGNFNAKFLYARFVKILSNKDSTFEKQAMQNFEIVANLGMVQAKLECGICLIQNWKTNPTNDVDVKKRIQKEIFDLFRSAAQGGSLHAHFILGVLRYDGFGVSKVDREADRKVSKSLWELTKSLDPNASTALKLTESKPEYKQPEDLIKWLVVDVNTMEKNGFLCSSFKLQDPEFQEDSSFILKIVNK